MTQQHVTVALDVGGTAIKCALVDTAGTVRRTARRATGAERGPDAVVETILTTAAELATEAADDGLTPVAVGVVVAASIDELTGVAVWSANLGLRDVPLRDLVAKRVGLPTALGHDARAGALAEARLGAGRTSRRMLFVAAGTGIGGGYVVDGRIDHGAHGASGEIGHVAVRRGPDARRCACGGRGCMEAYASASAIARAYAAGTAGAAVPPGEQVSAAEIATRVAAGEPHATRVWGEAVAALADGLLIGIALLDPELVVLGGGLARAGAVLLDPLRQELHRRRTFQSLPDLAGAELGDEAGCQGAALLALDLTRDHNGQGVETPG